MPGQGRKHLQLAGIGFADAWLGLEASAICWNWICRCLVGVGSICNLLDMNLQIHILGSEASATCWNWICRCLVRVGSICNLLELDLQIHIGVNSGRGSICNLLELDLQMPGRGWKHLQLVGIGFADAWPGLEASAICWNWICRCLVGGGSICNLLELDLQMPGQGWNHLQLAEIRYADTYRGELRTWKHPQLVGIGCADAWPGLEASATCWNWMCRCLARVGSICNLLELDLQMPGQDRKHLQFASIGAADAWSGLEASTTCWI